MVDSESQPQAESTETPEAFGSGGSRFIFFAIGGFIVTCIVLFALGSSLSPDTEPGYSITQAAAPREDGTFQITIDARENEGWTDFNFGVGQINSGTPDLRIQRHRLSAPAGAIALGKVAIADANVGPDAQWSQDEGTEIVENPALSGWYTYSYWTHLLSTRGETYAVRRSNGQGIAYFRVVSYYCDPDGSGCLTIRYRLENEAG